MPIAKAYQTHEGREGGEAMIGIEATMKTKCKMCLPLHFFRLSFRCIHLGRLLVGHMHQTKKEITNRKGTKEDEMQEREGDS